MASSDSGPENMHSVEKKVKERKDKKEGDTFPDHAETPPQIAKGGRKKKKAEDPEIPVEAEPVSSNPKVKEKKKKRKRDQGGEELPSDDKKKKQREREASGAIDDPTIDPPLEATGTTVAASEVKEKKKRNKNKSSAEASDPPPSSAIEFTPGAGVVDEPKKSRKQKSTNDVVDADGDGKTPPKPKSKSKKRKKEETIEDNEHPSTVLHTEGHPPQKRKKSKASVHPNPLDDSDLTEQSQKALTYIYSQSTSPETWKFNKARQNWVIRNIWTSKVPEKYVPMVVDYLSKVQGRVKETLIESCNNVISGSPSGNPVTQAGADEKDSSEKPNLPAPTTTGSEKTQRAYALLYALTKKP